MSNTRQQVINLLAGTTFAIAGTTFLMSDDGHTWPAVTTEDGSVLRQDEAVEIDGSWYPKDDCVVTHDGSFALRDGCTEVYDNWARPSSHLASYEMYSEAQLEDARENGLVEYVSSRGAYYTDTYCVYSEHEGEHLHRDDAVEIDGEYYPSGSDVVRCDGHGTYFIEGDDGWVSTDYDYWPVDECHECDGVWVHGEESDCSECGSCAGRICEYHNSPKPYLYRGSSGWLVGFEVEKSSVNGCEDEGDRVEELPLFSGWECDGSCGVEGITNVYDPLDPQTRSLFQQHLRVSREYVDGPTNAKCGGHINLSHNVLNNSELFYKFRKYAGIYYALYKGRLDNEYCCGNKSLLYSSDKYVAIKRKPFGIELRLVSKVPNAEVLLRRFDLIAATCKCIDGNVTFSEALRMHKDVMLDAYHNDRVKVASILRLARHFQKWVHTNESHPSIERYLS